MTARRGWPEDVRQRAYALWCGAGVCNAARTARLLRQEHTDGGPGPGASTVRRWSAQDGWKDWVGKNPPPLGSQDLAQWTRMWRRHVVRQVATALRVQNDILTGRFDGDLSGADTSLPKGAASMEQLLAQPGVLAFLRVGLNGAQSRSMSLPERERHLRRRLVQRKTQR
jgi:hypothetical protein